MFQITKLDDEIRFRENSDFYFFGAVGFAISVFVAVYLADNVSLFLILSLSLACIAVILIGLLSPHTITTQINRRERFLSRKIRGLLDKRVVIYSFEEIADLIYVEEKKATRGAIDFNVILPLKSGRKVELFSTMGLEQSYETAELINSYIFDSSDQIPFKLPINYDN